MAALKSMNMCFYAARQAAGLKASRLIQHRTFRIIVSYGEITSRQYSARIIPFWNVRLLANGNGLANLKIKLMQIQRKPYVVY